MTVGAGSTVSQPGEGSGVALIDTTITAGTSGRILVENVTGSFKTGAKPLLMASSPSSGITSDIVTTVSGVQYLGEADINDDILWLIYPNMEPPDPGQDIFANPVNKITQTHHQTMDLGLETHFITNGLSTTPSQPNPVLGVFVIRM